MAAGAAGTPGTAVIIRIVPIRATAAVVHGMSAMPARVIRQGRAA